MVDDSLDDAHLPATGRHHRGSVVGAGVEDDADHDGQARELRRRDDGVDAGGDAVAFVVGGDDHDDAGDPGRCGVVRRTHGGYGGASTGPIRGAHGGYSLATSSAVPSRAPHSAHHTPLSAGWRGISRHRGKYTSPWEVRSPPRAPPRPPVPPPHPTRTQGLILRITVAYYVRHDLAHRPGRAEATSPRRAPGTAGRTSGALVVRGDHRRRDDPPLPRRRPLADGAPVHSRRGDELDPRVEPPLHQSASENRRPRRPAGSSSRGFTCSMAGSWSPSSASWRWWPVTTVGATIVGLAVAWHAVSLGRDLVAGRDRPSPSPSPTTSPPHACCRWARHSVRCWPRRSAIRFTTAAARARSREPHRLPGPGGVGDPDHHVPALWRTRMSPLSHPAASLAVQLVYHGHSHRRAGLLAVGRRRPDWGWWHWADHRRGAVGAQRPRRGEGSPRPAVLPRVVRGGGGRSLIGTLIVAAAQASGAFVMSS